MFTLHFYQYNFWVGQEFEKNTPWANESFTDEKRLNLSESSPKSRSKEDQGIVDSRFNGFSHQLNVRL